MAQVCRALLTLAFAVVVARSSMTVSWNTHRAPSAGAAGPAAVKTAAVKTAAVVSVRGTHVLLRLRDGTAHAFIATPAQARMLQRLIGTVIQFRTP